MLDHTRFSWVPVPWCRRSCPLSWSERVVWGCLVAHPGDGRSVRSLEPLVPISRPTIGAAIAGLERHGLVHKERGVWHAVEPTGRAEWFAPKDGPTWQKRISYWPCVLPSRSCPLPGSAVGLCWLAAALQRHERPTTAAGLAGFLGCDPKTVSASIRRLAERGVMRFTRCAGGRTRSRITFADALPPAWDSWWERRRNKAVEPKPIAKVERDVPIPLAAGRGDELSPVPQQVKPAPVVQAAAEPKQDNSGLPDWMLRDWLDVMGKARIPERDQRAILRLVERHDTANSDLGGTQLDAVEYIRPAHDKHDPDKANGRRDCGGFVIHRLTNLVAEAESDRRVRDRKAADQELVWAPLKELALGSRWWPCRSCGEPGSWEIGQTVPEDRWPDEVREIAAALRQLEGVRTWDVSVGPCGCRCTSCKATEPGLLLRCSRELIVGRSYVSAIGYRGFPEAAPLAEPTQLNSEPPTPRDESAEVSGGNLWDILDPFESQAEVPATDFLDKLGPPPAWSWNPLEPIPKPLRPDK